MWESRIHFIKKVIGHMYNDFIQLLEEMDKNQDISAVGWLWVYNLVKH